MIQPVNNHKTTVASLPALPRAATGLNDAPRRRARTAEHPPRAVFEPTETERGRGRTRLPAPGQADRVGQAGGTAVPRMGRPVAVEAQEPPMPPGLAARARLRRATEPNQTLPTGGLALPWATDPPGFHIPIEIDRYLSELPQEAFLPHLSFSKKCAIIVEALKLDNELDYSTAAMVCATSRLARLLEKRLDREVRFAEVSQQVPMGDQELVKTYNGGTCFSLAANLMGHIKDKFNVASFALIAEHAPPQMALWPSLLNGNAMVAIEDIKIHVSGIGHTDVVIPYLKGDERRALVLPTGQPIGANHSDESLAERGMAFGRERLMTEPHVLAFRALWGRARLHIAKRQDDSIFGIDFLASEIFINRHAAKNLQVLLHGPDAEPSMARADRKFKFAGLVRRDSVEKSQEAEADWQRCLKFLALVNRLFKLGNDTLSDIAHLIDRRQSFLEDMVHPWAVTMRDTQDERAVVLELADRFEQAQLKHQKTAQRPEVWTATQNLRGCLFSAQSSVLAGDIEHAKAEYGKARQHAEAGLSIFGERRAR